MVAPRLRISVAVTLVVTASLLLATIVVSSLTIREISIRSKQSLINQTKTYTLLASLPLGDAYVLYRDSGTDLLEERVEELKSLDSSVTNIAIYDVKGTQLYSHDQQTYHLTSQEAETFEPIFQSDAEGYLRKVIYPYKEISGAHRYTFVYDISSAEIRSSIADIYNQTVVTAGVLLLIITLVILGFIEFLFVRPIKRMSVQAAAISAGSYDLIIRLHRRDEISDLGNALTTMAANLKADITKLKQAEQLKSEFLIISSHNFRTPLTIITGYIELLQELRMDKTAQEYIDVIDTHTKELTELTNDMLTVAELEGQSQPKLNVEPVDVLQVLRDIKPELQKRLSEKDQHLEQNLPEGSLQLSTQKRYLITALWNLLDNAIKFTPEKGTIGLSVQHDPSSVRILITDTGIGIPPEEVQQLFTKFHRGTSIMQYEYEGVGLGLYMTKLMLEFVGGTIEVTTAVGKGSTFTIVLPKRRSADTAHNRG